MVKSVKFMKTFLMVCKSLCRKYNDDCTQVSGEREPSQWAYTLSNFPSPRSAKKNIDRSSAEPNIQKGQHHIFPIIRQDHSSISAQDWQIVEFVFVKLLLAVKIRIVSLANIIWPIVAGTIAVLLNIIMLGENFHVTPMCHVDSSVLGPIVVIRMVKSSMTL